VGSSGYSAFETLRDGRRVEIRALRAADRADLLEAFGRMSDQSRYYRFFAPKRALTVSEIAYFTDVDFVKHVALVAVVDAPDRRLVVGGGRYIVTQPGGAELAFGVDDAHQGLGIASPCCGTSPRSRGRPGSTSSTPRSWRGTRRCSRSSSGVGSR
jgi:hypothetical protein